MSGSSSNTLRGARPNTFHSKPYPGTHYDPVTTKKIVTLPRSWPEKEKLCRRKMSFGRFGSKFDARLSYPEGHTICVHRMVNECKIAVPNDNPIERLWKEYQDAEKAEKKQGDVIELPPWAYWIRDRVLQPLEASLIASSRALKDRIRETELAYFSEGGETRAAIEQIVFEILVPEGNEDRYQEGQTSWLEIPVEDSVWMDMLGWLSQRLDKISLFDAYLVLSWFGIIGSASASSLSSSSTFPVPEPTQQYNSFIDLLLYILAIPFTYIFPLLYSILLSPFTLISYVLYPLVHPLAVLTYIYTTITHGLWLLATDIFIFVHTHWFLLNVQAMLVYFLVLYVFLRLTVPFLALAMARSFQAAAPTARYVWIRVAGVVGDILIVSLIVAWRIIKVLPGVWTEVREWSWMAFCGYSSWLWNCGFGNWVCLLPKRAARDKGWWFWIGVGALAGHFLGEVFADWYSPDVVRRSLLKTGQDQLSVNVAID